ncbi:DMT family transporter [Thermococcus sp.]|uniref:DMT family transporter n=1 Tax=Thermococcus sp. TaxID=35749 RepID=UPI00261A8A67|nr:DMT family transporter [Thermococcus sp.]
MRGKAEIVASMLIWGSVGIFSRLSGLSGLGVAFARVSLGSMVLLPALLFRGKLKKAFETLMERKLSALLLGLVLALNWVFLFTAFNRTTIANAVLVYYLSPVMATLMSWRFLGESIGRRWMLIGMAFTGFLIIALGNGFDVGSKDFQGVILALIAGFFYAMIPNLGRAMRDVDGEVLTFLQLALASLFLLPFVLFLPVGKPVPWAVAILVLVHTVLALYIYMDGLKKVEVNEVALLSYLDPLSAVVYAFLVFGEVPTLETAIGGALILLASAMDVVLARGP